MFDWLFLIIALGGTAIAGLIDLKTTEIPDAVPLSMVVLGLAAHIARALTLSDWSFLLWGLGIGAAFLAFGYLLYLTGQWGEADAIMLAAIGFLLPQPLAMFPTGIVMSGFIYPLTLLINLFAIGAAYSVIYAFIVALRNPMVFPTFFRDVKGQAKSIAGLLSLTAIGLAIVLIFSYIYLQITALLPIVLLLVLSVALFLLYRFAVVLENKVFKKRIPTSQLREGDVLAEDIKTLKMLSKLYIGLDKKQIRKIRNIKDKVWIKEGIRYSPVFFFTILVTWAFGNALFVLMGLAL